MVNHEVTAAENCLKGSSTRADRPQIPDELDLNMIHLKKLEEQMLLLCPATYNLQKRNIKRKKKEKSAIVGLGG